MENNKQFAQLDSLENALANELKNLIKSSTYETGSEKSGKVMDFADGVGHMSSVRNAKIGLKLKFNDSTKRAREMESRDEPEIFGLTVDIDEDTIGYIAFGEEKFIKQGDLVEVSDELLTIPVSELMLGRVVDPFCRAHDRDIKNVTPPFKWFIDEDKEILKDEILSLPIERKAPGVIDRSKIKAPLQTGIKTIDSMLPIGRGQRMLVIGDRATGKTSIGLDTIKHQNEINQALNPQFDYNKDDMPIEFFNLKNHDPKTVYCIYVAIGRKASEVRQIAEQLKKERAMHYTIIVAAMANDPASLLYIAPFSGCTIGEYFRDTGRHAMIVYDDLSKHATAYRQISLLLRRPPGREAFPGDIFYLHSRLLERASSICSDKNFTDKKISDDYHSILEPFWDKQSAIQKDLLNQADIIKPKGGGSLTAFPIIETKQNDVASYIPTNVISITDGQVYLLDKLFNEGFKPAINIGISVSRVGSNAQTSAMKEVSDGLISFLANHREKEKNLKFVASKSAYDIQVLDRGRRINHFLKQREFHPVDVVRQIVSLFIVRRGFYDVIPETEKLETHCHEFENHIWDCITRDVDLGKFVQIDKRDFVLKRPLSSLKINDYGVFFIQQLSDSMDNWQRSFFEKHSGFSYRAQLLDIFKQNITPLFSNFLLDYNQKIQNVLERDVREIKNDEKTTALSLSNNQIIPTLDKIRELLPKIDLSERFEIFKMKDQKSPDSEKYPSYLNVTSYKTDIMSGFLFNYFIEEKQKLKRDFILKIDEEFGAEIKSPEFKAFDEVRKIALSFLMESEGKVSSESNERVMNIRKKAKDTFTKYLRKQIIEITKIEKTSSAFHSELINKHNLLSNDPLIGILAKFSDALKKLRETIDMIITSLDDGSIFMSEYPFKGK